MKEIQNKQQQRIIFSSTLKSNLAATTNNLANKIDLVDRKLNSTQEKQLKLTSDLRDHGHGNKQPLDQLESHIKNFANEFKLIDEQMETAQQKQNELSRFGIGNEQKINAVWTNLTENIHRLEEKLNSTQVKQLEMTSDIRNHGHGNKQRIEQLTSQITNFKSDFEIVDQEVKTVQQQQAKLISKDDLLDRRMNVLWTNITFYMNQIERQAFENITDLSSQMNSTTKKVGLLWINFLDGKNLISPILQKYRISYADSIDTTSLKNKTDALRQEIEQLDVDETAEYKRIVTDHIPVSSIKLHPIDSNLKKVKITFTVHPFERNNLYFTLGNFDGEA